MGLVVFKHLSPHRGRTCNPVCVAGDIANAADGGVDGAGHHRVNKPRTVPGTAPKAASGKARAGSKAAWL